ncbi:MAG TPA: DnaA/Hda family protein, partial [Burkholderiales bacterium]|nr:DnaA/Hda family protein [Burkholderiales bacterium]
MQHVWQSCLARLEKELPAQQFNTWIRPIQVDAERSTDAELRLTAPNRFVLQWIKERFLNRIETMASDQLGTPMLVSIGLAELEAVLAKPATSAPETTLKSSAPAKSTSQAARNNGESRPGLIQDFNFDNFVPGKANQLARAAAMQVAENPGTSYNPLFVYGGVGLGKTHLIHAVGNYVTTKHPGARVRYLHAAQYISDVVRAYQQKSFDAFKRYYHSLDVLLIDDIQFFTGKDRTQEEFFYAFNALIEAHKQIIITCDTYPRDITGIDER